MSTEPRKPTSRKKWSRRDFLLFSLGAGAVAAGGGYALGRLIRGESREDVFIAKAADYGVELTSLIKNGLKELGLSDSEIKGKRILLKPNIVEPRQGQVHICTHPLVVEAAAAAFRSLGAAKVIVAEGSGHCTDLYRTLDESGMAPILAKARLPFVDLNRDDIFHLPNQGQLTELKTLCFPATLKQVDWIVSMPKLKTHHWAGVTMSMKNLFGVMPGIVYGWPKNVLHHAGVIRSILDINATLKPHFAIVDGIVGMEGDGPIMGTPKAAGLLVMGRNLPAVDATCARIMGLDPLKVQYLKAASAWLGSIDKANVNQRGEAISSVQTNFALIPSIPAHRRLMKKG